MCVCVCVCACACSIETWHPTNLDSVTCFIIHCLVMFIVFCSPFRPVGRDSSVGIETRSGLDRTGIESVGGRDFPHPCRPAVASTHFLVRWVPSLFWGVKWLGRGVDHPPHPAPRLKKEYNYTLLPVWTFMICSEVNLTRLPSMSTWCYPSTGNTISNILLGVL